MTISTADMSATDLARWAVELLPHTSVYYPPSGGSYVLEVNTHAEQTLRGVKAKYGEGNSNLLKHFVVRMHNTIQREAEELIGAE